MKKVSWLIMEYVHFVDTLEFVFILSYVLLLIYVLSQLLVFFMHFGCLF